MEIGVVIVDSILEYVIVFWVEFLKEDMFVIWDGIYSNVFNVYKY